MKKLYIIQGVRLFTGPRSQKVEKESFFGNLFQKAYLHIFVQRILYSDEGHFNRLLYYVLM